MRLPTLSGSDAVNHLKEDLQQVAAQARRNVDRAATRGGKIEELVERSSALRTDSSLFRLRARAAAPEAPPSRWVSRRIRLGLLLTVLSLGAAAAALATTSALIVTVDSPTNSSIGKLDATFGLLRQCVTAADAGSACSWSRAVGTTTACPKHEATDGVDDGAPPPSLLGLIALSCSIFTQLLGFGFSGCATCRPDSVQVFAVVAVTLGLVGVAGSAVCVWAWVGNVDTDYFISPVEWCIGGQIGNTAHAIGKACGAVSADCETGVGWGYTLYILFVSTACAFGAFCCQVVEAFYAFYSYDSSLVQEKCADELQPLLQGESSTVQE